MITTMEEAAALYFLDEAEEGRCGWCGSRLRGWEWRVRVSKERGPVCRDAKHALWLEECWRVAGHEKAAEAEQQGV